MSNAEGPIPECVAGSLTAPPEWLPGGGHPVPVIEIDALVVGTGSAGYCAADRLWEAGMTRIAVIADMIGAGSSRNAGSDKQTYYKLTLAGGEGDSVQALAETLFSGGAMDGDIALAEAAQSARGFLRLCGLGVTFPHTPLGEYVGYKTDHDPRRRATSVGPYTSRSMVEALERKVRRNGTPVFDRCRVVEVLTAPAQPGEGGVRGAEVGAADASRSAGAPAQPGDRAHERSVVGLLVLRNSRRLSPGESPLLLFRTPAIVYATGGPAGIYERRVFPNGQWGASGAALRAGVRGKNLTEWQLGLASIAPRWNVSGSYMQVIPRIVSTAADGSDEREFLADDISDYGRLLSLVFLKGYQWPFDVRKAHDGSSLIDMLVFRETTMRGRRVFLDFRTNPCGRPFEAERLIPEAREYLRLAGCESGTPIERLRILNEPAYRFYRERNPSLDLEHDLLEIDLCAQHNNGGLAVDARWESNVAGFYPVGEAAGAHGVYRPGGAALNSGQVGATRAAQAITHRQRAQPPADAFTDAAQKAVRSATELLAGATARYLDSTAQDNTAAVLRRVQSVMSEHAGPVRSAESVGQALTELSLLLRDFPTLISANPASRRSVDRVFLTRDLLTTAVVYLHAMHDYVAHGGHSRGSVLYSDPGGRAPDPAGTAPESGRAAAIQLPTTAKTPRETLPARFRFTLDDGALDGQIQEVQLSVDVATGKAHVTAEWRERRPLPQDDDFFENVWRRYREHGPLGES